MHTAERRKTNVSTMIRICSCNTAEYRSIPSTTWHGLRVAVFDDGAFRFGKLYGAIYEKMFLPNAEIASRWSM